MQRREFLQGAAAGLPAAAMLRGASPTAPAIALPKPDRRGGKPLMEALSGRRTTREIGSKPLPAQTLSNVLWAAWGVNRSETGKRTAPSAMNRQEIDLYVFLPEGVYLFDASAHSLRPVLEGDHRADTGTQSAVRNAAVSFVYVADVERAGGSLRDWVHADVGFIAQNVYLAASSEGLGCWFRASLDAVRIAGVLGLRASQKPLYSQGIGYPAAGV